MASFGRHVDPRALAAIEHLRTYSNKLTGPILLRNLPAALPSRGKRHSWREAITVYLLCELVSVHRVLKGKNPYWRGVLYQVNRGQLAVQFGCQPDDVSGALQWLCSLGVVYVQHHTRIDGLGKPCGTEVFAVPRMDRIGQLLDFFLEKGRAITASELIKSDPLQQGLNSASEGSEHSSNGVSSNVEQGTYLNCRKRQQKPDAEGGVVASLLQAKATERGRRSRDGAEGGGGADAEEGRQVPPTSSAAARRSASAGRTVANGAPSTPESKRQNSSSSRNPPPSLAAPPLWTPPKRPSAIGNTEADKLAWIQVALFSALWSEAIVRQNVVTVCQPNDGDLRAAFGFFRRHRQTGAHYAVAVALNAWWAADREKSAFDRQFLCRQSRELQAFMRHFATGKLESEIGQLGWRINAFKDLRTSFTQSELQFYHWDKIPVLAIDPKSLWENDPDAPDYYRVRDLQLPPEVDAAYRTQQECS